MDFASAKYLVLSEGIGNESMVVAARMGDELKEERFEKLLLALAVVYEHSKGQRMIERDLAHALFCLGVQLPAQIESWRSRGKVYREHSISDAMLKVVDAIESIFEDAWIEHP